MKTPVITICSSANFYKQAVDIQDQLNRQGIKVVVPSTAERMKQNGDYDVAHYKTWYGNEEDYVRKTALMTEHFEKVVAGDAILVLNYEKHGVDNYIGGNVLMEMALAFHYGKPIYIMNDLPQDSPFFEEIRGMNPVVMQGDLKHLDGIYSPA